MASALSTIANAQKVLASGNELAGNPAIPPPRAISPWKNMHWSAYLVASGALIALVSGVALAILGNYAMVVICAVLVVTQLIGAYYIKELGPYKELATIADQFGVLVVQIRQNQQRIVSANQQMQKTNQAIQVSTEKAVQAEGVVDAAFRRGGEVVEKLQSVTNQSNQSLKAADETLEKRLRETEKALNEMMIRYGSIQRQLEELKELVRKYEDAQKQVSQDTFQLVSLANTGDRRTSAFQKQREEVLKRGCSHFAALQQKIASLQAIMGADGNKLLQSAMESLQVDSDNFLRYVKKEFDELETALEHTIKEMQALKSHDQRLLEQISKFNQGTDELMEELKNFRANPHLPASQTPQLVEESVKSQVDTTEEERKKRQSHALAAELSGLRPRGSALKPSDVKPSAIKKRVTFEDV